MDSQQILFFIIMIGAIGLFIWGRLRVDVVGILIILSLAISGVLDVKSAFNGFGSEPALIVCAVFVLSAGLARTGVTDMIGNWIAHLAGGSETRANTVIMSSVALLSAFTHHLMVTAMMLPIVMRLCHEKGFYSSRLLIPMATAASLGTTLTLIGAPAFLLANNILQRSGVPALSFFSPAWVGGPIVLASLGFILLSRFLLPKRSGPVSADERFMLSEISTEIIIPDQSQWIGRSFEDFQQATDKRFQIVSWMRDHQTQNIGKTSAPLEKSDIFLVKTSPDELISIEETLGLALRAIKKFGADGQERITSLADEDHRLFEALIGPGSEFIGQSLSQIHFFDRYGVVAVGIWRKEAWMSGKLSDIPLRAGDLVVLWGPEDQLEKLTEHRGFLMFLPFQGKPKRRWKMNLSACIMGASILVAALGWLPAHVAFMTGALMMVLSGCLSLNRAYESIETKIFVMIAGVIPLGMAMEKTGVDRLLADAVLYYISHWPPFTMLLVFFWFAALLTQILSDAATTVLLAPIAVVFAQNAGLSPTAAVVAVTIGAVASFLTPIGHHGNLLILSPGGYKFSDFLKMGLPLTLMISVLTCSLSLWAWPV